MIGHQRYEVLKNGTARITVTYLDTKSMQVLGVDKAVCPLGKGLLLKSGTIPSKYVSTIIFKLLGLV
jgi:hypothetical protein